MTKETDAGKTRNLLERAAVQKDSGIAAESCVTGAERVFPSVEAAENKFSHFHGKLLHVARWNAQSGISSFELFDRKGGAPTGEIAAVGDFIKITLPGSGKADWVKVVEIYETEDEIVLSVRPSNDPTDSENQTTTSHFFTGEASNNFCLRRENETISFYVIGLNERINTTETGGFLETARNYATAHLGHFLGIQKAQWETFCRNFLEGEISEK